MTIGDFFLKIVPTPNFKMTVYLNLINISRLIDDHTSLILFTSGCYSIQISRNIEKRKRVKKMQIIISMLVNIYKANQLLS